MLLLIELLAMLHLLVTQEHIKNFILLLLALVYFTYFG